MKNKTIIIALTAVAAIGAKPLFCSGSPTVLKPISISYETGVVNNHEGNKNLYVFSLRPKFDFGNLKTVVGLNAYVDDRFHVREKGNDSVTLESLEYAKQNRFKAKYGDIENMTLGSGFIVNNYRSDIKSNISLNRQKGLDLDLYGQHSMVKYFGTRSKLNALRGVREMGATTLGATIVEDSTPNFKEYGIDAQRSVIPKKVSAYAEAAKIQKYGSGVALGTIVTPVNFANVKVEYRRYDADFIPGIVDEHFEARPLPDQLTTAATGRKWGMFSSVDLFNGKKNSAQLTYENYKDVKPRATAMFKGTLSKSLSLSLFFAKENFIPNHGLKGDNVARAVADLKLTRRTSLILDYFEGFDDSNQPLNSLTLKAKYKLR